MNLTLEQARRVIGATVCPECDVETLPLRDGTCAWHPWLVLREPTRYERPAKTARKAMDVWTLRLIRREWRQGSTRAEIARQTGFSVTTVAKYVRGIQRREAA